MKETTMNAVKGKPVYFNLTVAQSAFVEALKLGGVGGVEVRRIMAANGVKSGVDNWIATFPEEVHIAEDSVNGRVMYYLVDDRGEFVAPPQVVQEVEKVERSKTTTVRLPIRVVLACKQGALDMEKRGRKCTLSDYIEAAVLDYAGAHK